MTDSIDIALQWGRGLKTPEMAASLRARTTAAGLQWGRGLKTPEIQTRRERQDAIGDASMGPGS